MFPPTLALPTRGREKEGQTVLEYILLIGIVTIALVYMGTDIKRGIQSVIKVTADQIGNQQQSEQDFSATGGYLVNSASSVKDISHRSVQERIGVVTTASDDFMQTTTNSLTNAGFTPTGN
ncbi:MAG: hypothetical protein HY209_02975 [Candidatus Omnitrophica bacterium]|nr:hypothetical protein [Candidatus Omnitrophota bacterium]